MKSIEILILGPGVLGVKEQIKKLDFRKQVSEVLKKLE
jgi:hypothetical protein